MSAPSIAKPKRAFHPTSGGASLGFPGADLYQLIDSVEAGFPFTTIEKFQKVTGISLQSIARMLQIPDRTLARRRASGKLASDESERLLRLARVFEKAVALFEGDRPAANRWLSTPQKALGGKTPFNLARTEIGGKEVEALIGRLEHGVFS